MWQYFPNGYILSTLCDHGVDRYEACILKYYEYQPETIIEKLKKFLRIQTRFVMSKFVRQRELTNLPIEPEYKNEESFVCFRHLTRKQMTILEKFVKELPKPNDLTVIIKGTSFSFGDKSKITWLKKGKS